MLVVGLTGGIACGKSTVTNIIQQTFDEKKITIIDADKIAREIVGPGKPAYNKIVTYFSDKIENLLIDTNGNNKGKELNRQALGAYVFQNKQELAVLNSITHPQIRYEIFKKILYSYLHGVKLVVLDVPLLFEAHLDIFCGATVSVIISEPELQIERLMLRNKDLSRQDALQRISSQMSTEEKILRSDYVIDNSGTAQELKMQVLSLFKKKLKQNFIVYLLELFPPIGLISALNVVISKYIRYVAHKKSPTKKVV
ncbi:related to Dephospho-CoA kinase CAB5 [Saccharomycodes ludwigii]|uniref:Related to Dephospho-CoA kinase CAB5 n=1 Tax=Saccharomycodes ludwigii TaxID=36035 RepID=A0A376B0T4_9ASCO|nr:hypothetical protein SCDLUD_001875 [Saccharomycodes ludwigii]KAH3902064.1 hypothetical protein SCDLUD_001875 [Saccharomycodes ludwigii]SSD58296.1 related to Dephospho-CoA kinase CAB5 [Saccharomycodes ludwigii]